MTDQEEEGAKGQAGLEMMREENKKLHDIEAGSGRLINEAFFKDNDERYYRIEYMGIA